MTKLLAYHGRPSIKKEYLDRVKAHEKADCIVKGQYWENGKGCAVGCTIEGSDHGQYETELGMPKELAYLEDVIFEELTNGDAKRFPKRFLAAIKPGADLSLIVAKFVVWQFEDKKYGLSQIKEVKKDREIYGFCEEVVALYKREIAGDKPSEDAFYDLYLKICGAGAGAGAWAGAWAGAGAGAGARAWAWARARAGARAWAGAGAGARAGARAWAGADYDDAYNSSIKAASEKLISLLKEAPCR